MSDQATIAVVGTGVIGASWAALFISRGFRVNAWDPSPASLAAVRDYIGEFLPQITSSGQAVEQLLHSLNLSDSLEDAVAGVSFVQENGPENLALKQDLFARIDRVLPPGAVIASSSSTLMPSDIQAACAMPERVLVGHPFNPPHLIPLVEVVGGRFTQQWAVERAMEFYRGLGKHPILIKKEVRGHVANRLQAALWQEALHLVREGIVDVADVDAAITSGPGLRWACVGPLMGLHLSGGDGGIVALFGKPLWAAVEEIWSDLGHVKVDEALGRRVEEQVVEAMGGQTPTALSHRRDHMLQYILGGGR